MASVTPRVRGPREVRACLASALCGLLLTAGCAGNYLLVPRAATADGVTWVGPAAGRDLPSLDRWRRSVGPSFIARTATTTAERPVGALVLVSWNTAVGTGDVIAFLRALRERHGADVPVVLLLQEAYRKGPDVPAILTKGMSFASRLGLTSAGSPRDDIAAIAARSGLHAYDAPSMRNGSPLVSDEDRGNAILSSLPLSQLSAIELPFERQRRVAVAATVTGTSLGGTPWSLRVVSAHLDNVAGARRLWLFGRQFARMRQARALVSYLDGTGAVVLAGDFNTWFGFADPAYRETARAFHAPLPSDRRGTFRGRLRLDHMFFRLPDGWRAEATRADSSYGSDHFPLVATIAIGSQGHGRTWPPAPALAGHSDP